MYKFVNVEPQNRGTTLSEIVNMSLNTQDDVNTCVHHFYDVVSSIVLPHCIVKEGCVHDVILIRNQGESLRKISHGLTNFVRQNF